MLPECLVTVKRLQSAVARGDKIDMKKHGKPCFSDIMLSVYLFIWHVVL